MSAKKTLKLEVKTLETRIAPGACRSMHDGLYTDPGAAQQTWDDFSGRANRSYGSTEGGGNGGGGDNSNPIIPAGVPVIGIN